MDDQDLVARVRDGNLEAASELFGRYQDVAYTVALRLLGQPADAEDLAQEALVRAYTRLSELQQGASFPGWLRRITVNLSLNALRRSGQLQFESLDAERPVDAAPLREFREMERHAPEEAALASELRANVEAMLEKLPANQRVAVVLRDMYEYDVSEIAELQQCGISAAKMRIMRGRTMLRQMLSDDKVASPSESGERGA